MQYIGPCYINYESATSKPFVFVTSCHHHLIPRFEMGEFVIKRPKQNEDEYEDEDEEDS